MSIDFLMGLALIPALFGLFIALKVLYALSTKAWWKLHVRMITTVPMKANPIAVRFRGDPAPETSYPKYEKSANRMRDALLTSPKFYSFFGLGWYIIVGRDIKDAEPEMQ